MDFWHLSMVLWRNGLIDSCLAFAIVHALFIERGRCRCNFALMKSKVMKWTLIGLVSAYLFIITFGTVVVLHILCEKHVEYRRVYDAAEAGLPAPDTLSLVTCDGYRIQTLEIAPEAAPKGVIICLTGIENPSVTAYYGHVRSFRALGLVSLLTEVRGHGPSDGERICLAYQETADVKAVTDYVEEHYQDLPVIVMGLSMGAAVAIRSIAENEDIDALISLSAFSSLQDFMVWHAGRFISPLLAEPLKLTTALAASSKFGVNAFRTTPYEAIGHLDGRPALLMHSRGDSQVPFMCFEKLFSRAESSTSRLRTYVVDGDEHFITGSFGIPEDDPEYSAVLLAFIKDVLAMQ